MTRNYPRDTCISSWFLRCSHGAHVYLEAVNRLLMDTRDHCPLVRSGGLVNYRTLQEGTGRSGPGQRQGPMFLRWERGRPAEERVVTRAGAAALCGRM